MESTDKRTLTAVILALIVLIGWQFLFTHPEQPQQPVQQQSAPSPQETPQPVVHVPVATDTPQARLLTVKTPLYTATVTSLGGTIKDFSLVTFRGKSGKGVSLTGEQPLLPPLGIGDQNEPSFSKVNFRVIGTDLDLSGTGSGTIIFEYATPQLSVRRSYTFHGNTYWFELKDEVAGLPDYWLTLGSHFGIYDAKDTTAQHIGPVILKGTERIELTASDIKEPLVYTEPIRWIAQEDKYFFAALIPSGPISETRIVKKQESALPSYRIKSGVNSFTVFAGPKEYEKLKELNVGLEHVIDFGFFSVLSRPLFWVLKFFNSLIGNYGWAIVLLTIVVRIPFIPLLNKSQKSMRKMQELQPRMNELREKYKNDPQRLQKEMMEMYKKYKINPMGGCLPILLQIPVFFALYKVLMVAIELRNAPFMGWITDLSEPDTLFGTIPAWFPLIGGYALGPLPILMGATMVIQQKMTPTSLDPKQNRIMMIMSVVFTFMFLNFASGLVLYWLVNNILSIIQQYFTNKKLSAEVK